MNAKEFHEACIARAQEAIDIMEKSIAQMEEFIKQDPTQRVFKEILILQKESLNSKKRFLANSHHSYLRQYGRKELTVIKGGALQ